MVVVMIKDLFTWCSFYIAGNTQGLCLFFFFFNSFHNIYVSDIAFLWIIEDYSFFLMNTFIR